MCPYDQENEDETRANSTFYHYVRRSPPYIKLYYERILYEPTFIIIN